MDGLQWIMMAREKATSLPEGRVMKSTWRHKVKRSREDENCFVHFYHYTSITVTPCCWRKVLVFPHTGAVVLSAKRWSGRLC